MARHTNVVIFLIVEETGMNGFLKENIQPKRVPGQNVRKVSTWKGQSRKSSTTMPWKLGRGAGWSTQWRGQCRKHRAPRHAPILRGVSEKMLCGFQGAGGISKLLWAAGSMSFAYKKHHMVEPRVYGY